MRTPTKARLSGWGRFPVADCLLRTPRDADQLAQALAAGAMIARGNGRAYGDSALNPENTVSMHRFNRMVDFDPATGRLVAEAGVLLGDIVEAFLPRGWFPGVTPGTRLVTLGGAIAADVHGKNHHVEGGFGNFVDWIEIMDAKGEIRRASRQENPELFDWTLGGMGLTGVILRAAIRLRPVETGWIRQHSRATPDLDATIAGLEAADSALYSVAWIDCLAGGRKLGRAVIMTGEHAALDTLPMRFRRIPFGPPPRRKLRIPFDLPGFALNRWSVRAFNSLYHRAGTRRSGTAYVPWESYFYPLDSILGWNRIYGRRGLLQFQCVLPPQSARAGLEALLRMTSAAGQGSFLAVLKKMGAGSGRFSFPMPGYTLALDFPATERVLSLMNDLDRITLEHGGRFYLAKDARLAAATLRAADPRADDFARMRRDTGAAEHFASLQSRRLEL